MQTSRQVAALSFLSLLGLIWAQYWVIPATTSAISEEVRWSAVNIPTEGESSGWVLASGADIRHLTLAANGTLYCYATPSGTTHRLFKSADDGGTWSQTGMVQDMIVDMATGPDNSLYYATEEIVYKSTDAGNTFIPLPVNPGDTGSDNLVITSIDIAGGDSGNLVAVATRDTDSNEFGGVYLLDESNPLTGWTDTETGGNDVVCITFSPRHSEDGQLLAVVTDETDTYVITRFDDNEWSSATGAAVIPGVVPLSAAIAFPEDYSALADSASLFLAIATGSDGGDLYMVTSDSNDLVATDLDAGSGYGLDSIDISSVASTGNTDNTRLLAGAASSAQVYISIDNGQSWTASAKPPTGQSEVQVLMATDLARNGEGYAVTSGRESSFSRTVDGGITWNQVSLTDTTMSAIVDLAVPLNYGGTLFILTFDARHLVHSLWRSVTNGISWERVFTSTPSDIDELNLVKVSPQYGAGSQVLFLAGIGNGNPVIWKSVDNGQSFTALSAPLPVDTWAVASNDVLFIGSFDGIDGRVFGLVNGSPLPPDGTAVGSQPISSVVVSPGYNSDQTVLAGNTIGQVYYSSNNGTSFEALGNQLSLVNGIGEVSITFDIAFSINQTIFAASSGEVSPENKHRIHRFIIGKSDSWQSIAGSLPEGSIISQLAISATGTLYAVDSQPVDTNGGKGGMVRSLSPTFPLGQTCEIVTGGLVDGTVLRGLKVSQNQLWSIDSQNIRLMSYIDTLSLPVTLESPANDEPGVDIADASLTWVPISGATEYLWQIDDDTSLSTVPDDFEGNTGASSVHLPDLEPGTTYYWHVRATKPVLSLWSTRWSFTTILAGGDNALELLSPEAGATSVSLRPVFQWRPVTGAECYELLVSTDVDFTELLIEKTAADALPATAWQSDIDLGYETTYYWKVRGISEKSHSAWSGVGAFTTESLPQEPEPEPETETEPTEPDVSVPFLIVEPEPNESETQIFVPPPSSQPSGETAIPVWATYVFVTLLVVIAVLLGIVIVMVVWIRRL